MNASLHPGRQNTKIMNKENDIDKTVSQAIIFVQIKCYSFIKFRRNLSNFLS